MSSWSSSSSLATYFSWTVSQASLIRPNSVGAEGAGPDAGFEVAPAGPPGSVTSRPTPIPALNVTTNASPTITPMSTARPPWPAALDVGAWEGPGVREVTFGGSWSVVGSVL